MNWMDLLRMSSSNLRRRKLRTFLTVLGVVIGTASIVVMISLGLGLQQAMYQEIEEYGGLTTVNVLGANGQSDMMYGSEDESDTESEKYVDDACLETLAQLEHVTSVEPVYTMSVMLLKGSYEGYMELMAMTPEGLESRKIELSQGTLPQKNSGQLELVYGNMTLVNFQARGTGESYWETGELPNIDLAKDSLFLILDQENYSASQDQSSMDITADIGDEGSEEGGGTSRPAKKHVVRGCGLVAGGVDDYNANCYYVFCDLDTLKKVLKKEFTGRVIPGQPQTKNGKPMKEFCYSYAQLKVDDKDNVKTVANTIKEMGYNVETNAEMMDSVNRQMGIIQAVLGGIGAVSLFVAAIGIANTMMMSIYERTKEIGVMKVLGCSLGNIRGMFLMEAGFIGIFGGIIGNILSLLMSMAINALTANSDMIQTGGANISYIPIWLMLASIGFAMLVGIVAGYFPAKRAMKLSPLEAIRNG
ncbi:ABC transporter permease [Lachnospiraceae bacterium MD308]|nr:ABC transporter permease [Lachnospiraceae bacterium MD308]MCI8580250.1 ABC transporter permease [Dorea sp.]